MKQLPPRVRFPRNPGVLGEAFSTSQTIALRGPVLAVGLEGKSMVPLDSDQEAWVRRWVEVVR